MRFLKAFLRAFIACAISPLIAVFMILIPYAIFAPAGIYITFPLFALAIGYVCTMTYGLLCATVLEFFFEDPDKKSYFMAATFFSFIAALLVVFYSGKIGEAIGLFLTLWVFTSIHALLVYWLLIKIKQYGLFK